MKKYDNNNIPSQKGSPRVWIIPNSVQQWMFCAKFVWFQRIRFLFSQFFLPKNLNPKSQDFLNTFSGHFCLAVENVKSLENGIQRTKIYQKSSLWWATTKDNREKLFGQCETMRMTVISVCVQSTDGSW